jgi:glutamate-1-semialdehyde 2,1-aminomutase
MRRGSVSSIRDLKDSNLPLRELFYFDMLEQGIWLARRGMINVSLPMSDSHCDRLVAGVESFVDSRAPLGRS